MIKKTTWPVLDDIFPELTEDEQALAQCDPSWGDFAYAVRTRCRFKRGINGKIESSLCFSFVQVKGQFDVYRDRLKNGDESAVVDAMVYACKERVPLPDWLAQEILDRVTRTYQTEATLHESFGLSKILPERGKKAVNARKKRKQRFKLWFAVHDAMNNGARSLDEALRQVLKDNSFSFGKTEARRLFNEQERIQSAHLAKISIVS